VEHWMMTHTAIAVIVLVGIWLAKTFGIKANRERTIKSVRNVFAGRPDDADPDDSETEEEKAKTLADKMDPGSPDFIAPGNIYRVLAVLNPMKLGFHTWAKYATKAAICCYMQLYLPTKILKHTLADWSLLGIKSPLWFMSNAGTFASMMAALASLCNMFAAKCTKCIMDGANANQYIMSHKEPEGAQAAALLAQDPGYAAVPTSQAAADDPAAQATAAAEAAMNEAKQEMAEAGGKVIAYLVKINQDIWCTISLTVNIAMSCMLQLIMFLKVATFTGAIDGIAVVAVSLYFIFDLDDKVFDADPALRKKYRRAVLKQTMPTQGPKYILRMANMSKCVLEASVPFGLLAIVLFSWRSAETGVVIGGDGITQGSA